MGEGGGTFFFAKFSPRIWTNWENSLKNEWGGRVPPSPPRGGGPDGDDGNVPGRVGASQAIALKGLNSLESYFNFVHGVAVSLSSPLYPSVLLV